MRGKTAKLWNEKNLKYKQLKQVFCQSFSNCTKTEKYGLYIISNKACKGASPPYTAKRKVNTQTKQAHVLAMHLSRAFATCEGKATMAKIYRRQSQSVLLQL